MHHRGSGQIADAREDFGWGYMLWLGSGTIGNTTGLSMARMIILPGGANDEHRHPNSEETLYLLAGEVEHSIGDAVVTQKAGDFISISPGVSHRSVHAGAVSADLIVGFSSETRVFEPIDKAGR